MDYKGAKPGPRDIKGTDVPALPGGSSGREGALANPTREQITDTATGAVVDTGRRGQGVGPAQQAVEQFPGSRRATVAVRNDATLGDDIRRTGVVVQANDSDGQTEKGSTGGTNEADMPPRRPATGDAGGPGKPPDGTDRTGFSDDPGDHGDDPTQRAVPWRERVVDFVRTRLRLSGGEGTTEITAEEAVARVRQRIEQALAGPVVRPDGTTRPNRFEGRFSTDPEQVAPEVDWWFLAGRCLDYSTELADAGNTAEGTIEPGSETFVVSQKGPFDDLHQFVVNRSFAPHVVIADPTLGGQTRDNSLRQVWVGTLGQLRERVSPEFVERYYGDNPVPVSPHALAFARRSNDERNPHLWDAKPPVDIGDPPQVASPDEPVTIPFPELRAPAGALEGLVVDMGYGRSVQSSRLPDTFSAGNIETYANWLSALTQQDPEKAERGALLHVHADTDRVVFSPNPSIEDIQANTFRLEISEREELVPTVNIHSHPTSAPPSLPDILDLIAGRRSDSFLNPVLLVATPTHNYLLLRTQETPTPKRDTAQQTAYGMYDLAEYRRFCREESRFGPTVSEETFWRVFSSVEIEFDNYYRNFMNCLDMADVYSLGFYQSNRDGIYTRLTRDVVITQLREHLNTLLNRALDPSYSPQDRKFSA